MTADSAHGHDCGRRSTAAAAPACSATDARMSGVGRHRRFMREILPRAGSSRESPCPSGHVFRAPRGP